MITKVFDQSLHDQYDIPSRNFVIKFYDELGIQAVDNFDKHGVDLILYKNGIKIGYAEVECCAGWTGATFPYKNYHVPQRKAKFFMLELPTEFFAVSNTFTRALHIDGEKILSYPLSIIPNSNVLSGEKFFEVDLKSMTLYGKKLMISIKK